MSDLSLIVQIDGKSDEYQFKLPRITYFRDFKILIASVVGKPESLLSIFNDKGTKIVGPYNQLGAEFSGAKPVRVTIDALYVWISQNRRIGYEVSPVVTTGAVLKRLVAKDIQSYPHLVSLYLEDGTPVTDGDLASQTNAAHVAINVNTPIYVVMKKPQFLVMEHRLLDKISPKTNVPFHYNGKTSNSPARVMGPIVDNLDDALAITGLSSIARIPEYDEVTNSYCLYSEGSIQYRAYDISARLQ
jgi:hypothetical protein